MATAPSVTDAILDHLGSQFCYVPTNPEIRPSQIKELEKNVKTAAVNRKKAVKRKKDSNEKKI